MEDYKSLELATLVDLLAEQTSLYTHLMSEGFKNGAEFSHIEQKILSLQSAIRAKQSSPDDIILEE